MDLHNELTHFQPGKSIQGPHMFQAQRYNMNMHVPLQGLGTELIIKYHVTLHTRFCIL